MQEEGINVKKMSVSMFTAVVKRRQVGKIECRDLRHANGK